jgi:hypothetical protein
MFLYFVPGNSCAVPKCLEYAFEGKTISRQQTMSGPMGSASGFLLANSDDPTRAKLDLPNQTWKRIPGIEIEAYCGVWNDQKITPSSLQRSVILDSHTVELDDGSAWQCAIARGFDSDRLSYFSNVPRVLELSSSGKWVLGAFSPQYRRFMQLALAYANANELAVDNGESTFAFDDVDELAVLGLTCNYKVSSIELSFLEDAYSVSVRNKLLEAILDFPTLHLWAKKKREADSVGSTTLNGQTQ